MAKTTRFITESGLRDFHVTFCTPMPGAELFKTAEQYGQFERDWKRLGFWEPAFIPHGLTKQELIDSHRRMYRRFYLRPRVIARYMWNCIKHPQTIANYATAAYNVLQYSLSGYVEKKRQALMGKIKSGQPGPIQAKTNKTR